MRKSKRLRKSRRDLSWFGLARQRQIHLRLFVKVHAVLCNEWSTGEIHRTHHFGSALLAFVNRSLKPNSIFSIVQSREWK